MKPVRWFSTALLGFSWILCLVGCHRSSDLDIPLDVVEPELGVLRAPEPVSPKNGRIFTGIEQVTLRWKTVRTAKGYSVEVARDSLFSSTVYLADTDTIFARTISLAEQRYFWRVRALNTLGVGGLWSEVWAFTVRRDNY